jgi:hypothetical protein
MTASKGVYAKRGSPLLVRLLFHTEKTPTCWNWSGYRNALGYGVFGHGRKSHLAHRVSYSLHVEPPGDLRVCHKCDNPSCVRPDHLFLGTDLDNTRDMIAKGRMRKAHGEGHADAKLTETAIREIRAAKPSYGYRKRLALKFGVSVGAIHHARKGKTWKHLL